MAAGPDPRPTGRKARVGAAPRTVVFYVRDNGIGIPEKHFEVIFRIFKRLHDRDAFGGGTGVGLTIVKKIIERHGGEIWLESDAGRGHAVLLHAADGREVLMSAPKHSLPLLLVEDSPEDRMPRSGRSRKRLANPIFSCVDGDDALDFLYRRGKYADGAAPRGPGVILLDLNLPGTDGREVLAEIKSDESLKNIPVIVLTTSTDERDIGGCYQAGANSYVRKPVNCRTSCRPSSASRTAGSRWSSSTRNERRAAAAS